MTANLSALVHRLAGVNPADAADADLLGRFVAGRDPAAFAELVRRHGPAVFGVCRRVTGDHHLAEDAFQAVFVVLAAKAASIRPPAALGGWLYGVAHRTALRARTMRDRRRRRERVAAAGRPEAVPPDSPDDLAAVLDAEIARLPAGLRAAVVLCELGGRSRAEAAAELGVKEGTLSSRLAAARKALAARLRTRGLALPAALGPAVLAATPPDLLARATAAALTPHIAPAAVAALSQGVLRAMLLQKLKLVPLALGVVASATVAAGLLAAPTQTPVVVPSVPAVHIAADPPAKALPTPKAVTGPNRIVIWRNAELVGLDPDGGKEKVVLGKPGAAGLQPFMLAMSPDGKRAAVVRIKSPVLPNPMPIAMPPVRLFIHEIGKAEPGVEVDEVSDAGTIAWSADGTELAVCPFTEGPAPADIKASLFVYTPATKTRTPVPLPDNHILTDWSRDGRYFLTMKVGRDRETPSAGLYVMNRDGTEHKRLTEPSGFAAFGRFSPDGKRVLATTRTIPVETPKEKADRETLGKARPRPRAELVVLDTATAKATPVKDVPLNAEVHAYCWSPDGKRIAYVWREEHPPGTDPMTETNSHLTVCDADGANQKTILSAKGASAGEMTLVGVDWR